MGLGGNLIWTSVIHELTKNGNKALICQMPLISDLVHGKLYCRDVSLENDEIFRNNPNTVFNKTSKKSQSSKIIDSYFLKLLSLTSLRKTYERLVSSFGKWAIERNNKFTPIYIDMRMHSYALHQKKKRTVWKSTNPAANAIAENFGISVEKPHCHLFYSEDEDSRVSSVLSAEGISGDFICIEPDTNQDWFGDLRAWDMTNWHRLITRLREQYPQVPIVQVGLGRKGVVPGIKSLTGKTSFREAALLIRHSKLFIGTEGGLMHAAATPDVNAVILWGGLTLPEFAGYPHLHKIVCNYVACAPCGNHGWCENKHVCMKSISVDQAYAAVRETIQEKNLFQ